MVNSWAINLSWHNDDLTQIRVRLLFDQAMNEVPVTLEACIVEQVPVDNLGRQVEREAPAAVPQRVVPAGLESIAEEIIG